jgi:hypothetical protein
MTGRRPCPSAPGPLEAYAAEFDSLFGTLAQRRGFREYLQGLLLPRDGAYATSKWLVGEARNRRVASSRAGPSTR